MGTRLERGPAARLVRPPPPLPCRSLPSPSFPSPPHLGARPAPAAGARPCPHPAGNRPTRQERPRGPASASAPDSNSSPRRCPLRDGGAGQGAVPAPGRPWDLCSRCRTPFVSRRVFPRDSLSPNPRSPSLPSRQAGAVPPAPPVPRGRRLCSPPRGPRCGHEPPASPPGSFVCFGFIAFSPALLEGALPPLSAEPDPRGPGRSAPPRTWAGQRRDRPRSALLLTGLSGSR